MSVAGGLPNAVERAAVHGCEALQVFTKNASQWRGRPLAVDEIERFRRRIEETGISPVVSHASYLINLATTDPALREQSIAAFIDELDRAEALGLLGVVIHPGTCTAGSEADALALIGDAIRRAFRARPGQQTMVLLEHTAGQGRTLAYCFEHLAAIIDHVDGSVRVGVCLDTCHLLASGYDIVSDRGYSRTFADFDRLVGVDRLRVFHGNDSKKPLGSRVDRHEHIGEGCLGVEPFRRLLGDPRFKNLAILIETEKEQSSSRPNAIVQDRFDVKNLGLLRRLRDEASRTKTATPKTTKNTRARSSTGRRS